MTSANPPENRVIPVVLSELGPGLLPESERDMGSVGSVEVDVTVDAGRSVITFGRLMQLSKGDLLGLDRTPDAPVDIRVNGTLVAKGDVVIVNEEVATRISEIA